MISVDISSDSTKFATGSATAGGNASIWSLTTGKRLLGPLKHDGWVVGVRFSPNDDRIATAAAESARGNTANSIRIYNSENGHLLLDIPFAFQRCSTTLVWSADGRQLFAPSYHREVKRFDTSSGSLLGKWSVPGDNNWPAFLILSHNQKFAAVVSLKALSFWDTSTYQQIGTTIEHTDGVWSIALSPDDDCIATGEGAGKVTLRSLRNILPASYLPVKVSGKKLYNVDEPDASAPDSPESSRRRLSR